MQRPKLRVWRKEATSDEIRQDTHQAKVTAVVTVTPRQPIPMSRLSELALVVDTGGVYRGENEIIK